MASPLELVTTTPEGEIESPEEKGRGSWWAAPPEEFAKRLPLAQKRMKIELVDEKVQRALDAQLWIEQQELLGKSTPRQKPLRDKLDG
jgi:hypothetical protein